uniref:Uncharacterized protein n=1 Tax=Neobodo designis TaxID=312471 RepID=A0A7S1QUP1_NEODS|mmetsp:Transcript_52490/g.161573  ORF Transcript_52490/g.161573 Transcript_52490/m.161573 type:complete len:139 (+) Transcript_52490:62-478(+)|eukprot:CAMPEP_0174849834 /NCGR_PEP_ID=MMETSP1114-20130205/17623_1 /TAXON_ID=312471 /ORGANISM="Neobodo designis, Strain CCAP 1951/1" /LENGTH=138 /DNA_ID=CAMNT_0016084243 /DNA_START=62 /DNA_END=478 /DNA_ORIENTATION=+
MLARRCTVRGLTMAASRATSSPVTTLLASAPTPQLRRFSLFGSSGEADNAANSDSTGGKWHLWRQDTHGNTECVDSFPSKSDAEAKCAELSCHEHKQHFWVAADAAMTRGGGADEAMRWFSSPAEDPLYGKDRDTSRR